MDRLSQPSINEMRRTHWRTPTSWPGRYSTECNDYMTVLCWLSPDRDIMNFSLGASPTAGRRRSPLKIWCSTLGLGSRERWLDIRGVATGCCRLPVGWFSLRGPWSLLPPILPLDGRGYLNWGCDLRLELLPESPGVILLQESCGGPIGRDPQATYTWMEWGWGFVPHQLNAPRLTRPKKLTNFWWKNRFVSSTTLRIRLIYHRVTIFCSQNWKMQWKEVFTMTFQPFKQLWHRC